VVSTGILAVLVLTGCGKATKAEKSQLVIGPGFRFSAPAGWQVTQGGGRASAQQGAELVQVVTFKLVKPYRDSLFDKVTTELDARMATIAQETGGKLDGTSTVSPAGIRSHSYRVNVADHVDEYTFVLRRAKEYQLLCRRDESSSTSFCSQLVHSFAIG
jgi:hypothetical protein